MDRSAIGRYTDAVLHALAGGAMVPPAGLLLLAREYAATGRPDIAEALGAALGQALAECGLESERARQPEWVFVFAECAALSEDERLVQRASDLAADLSRDWPSRGPVQPAMASVDACLAADRLARALGRESRLLAEAVDELERLVGLVYRPGEGVAASIDDHGAGCGDLADHVNSSSALLTAFDATGRLPYSMLAEELMQIARRRWWNDATGCFDAAPFATNCAAARVLCRLAQLHRDDDYREAAVIASLSAYADDARRTLDAIGSSRAAGANDADYAIALGEYLSI